MYPNFVSVDWYVPRIAARRAFRKRDVSVAYARAITSERLQNCFDCRIIQAHDCSDRPCTTPSSPINPTFLKYSARRFGRLAASDPRLKIPCSPAPLFIGATHSSISLALVGCVSGPPSCLPPSDAGPSYKTDLLASHPTRRRGRERNHCGATERLRRPRTRLSCR